MFNQIISIIVSVVMAISNFFATGDIISGVKELFAKEEPQPQAFSETYEFDDNGTMFKKYVDADGNEVFPDFSSEKITTRSSANSVLPSSYDARTKNLITSVKNQGSTGCCWAFSTCSALESSLISQGFETKTSVDLSEAHVAWFTNRSYVSSSSNPLDLEGITLSDPFYRGGSWSIASYELATWAGAANDSAYPFNSNNTANMQFAESERYTSSYHLTSALDYENATRDEIKQAVIDNGSVSSSIYYSDSYLKSSSLGYCYYQTASTGTNHAITIVGWNDNFPASYFISSPSSNGAWLVKNSWGTTWGTNGYFWLSYEDTSLSNFGVLMAIPAEDDYENNYQYDGFGSMYHLSFGSTSAYEANVFTAQGHEELGKCGFYTANDDATVEISVYKNVTTTPIKGTLLCKKTVNLPFNGYHTVEFDDKYELNEGEKFSIVLKISADSTAYLSCEGPTRNIYSDGTKVNYTSSRGQSYISSNGTSWTDYSRDYNNNPIKAFTNDLSPKFVLNPNVPINLEDDLIVGLYPDEATPAALMQMFSSSVSTDADTLYTGAKVNLLDNNGDVVKQATVVVFGDTDRNGTADGSDAFIITMIIYGMLNKDNTDKDILRAADYNNDGNITTTDFNLVFNSGLGIDSAVITT